MPRLKIARLFRLGSREAEEFDVRFWRRMSASERFAKTWQLSVEAYRLAGMVDEDEPRLRRSVVRLRRL
jgi:hypothetical protein